MDVSLPKVILRHLHYPIDSYDPNTVFGDGRPIFGKDIINNNKTISFKLGNGVTTYENLAELLSIPDGIIAGLDLTTDNVNAIISPGTWRINNSYYISPTQVTFPLDSQDLILSRYDTVYSDTNGNIILISGELSDTPVEPDIPDDTIKVGSILITPDIISLIPPPITNYVTTTTNQIVGGIKTFLSSPIVPTATLLTQAVNLGQLELVDEVLTGLVVTTVGTTATTTVGTWRIHNLIYSKGTSTATTIPAQDATLSRFTIIYATTSNTILGINGTLSADPIEPDIPANTVAVASILITPTSVTVVPTGRGTGTVTRVTGVNANGFTWTIATATTTPSLTLNQRVASASQSGQLSAADWTTFNNKLSTSANIYNTNDTVTTDRTVTLAPDATTLLQIIGSKTSGSQAGTSQFFVRDVRTGLISQKTSGINAFIQTSISSNTPQVSIGTLNGASTTSILFKTNTGILVTDTITLSGFTYAADYSAANTSNPRWIPDKAYVDSAIGGGSFYSIDGTLTSSRTVSGGGNTLQFSLPVADFTGTETSVLLLNGTSTRLGADYATGDSYNISSSISAGVTSLVVNRTFSGNTTGFDWNSSSTGITVKDQISSKGMSYFADYSAANTSNSRWIPDKAYVDAHAGTGTVTSVTPADVTTATIATTTTTPVITIVSAPKLQTARNIQGVSFNGTANIDIINGTGFVKTTGTTLSYDNSTYLTTSSASSTYMPLSGGTFTNFITLSADPTNALHAATKSYVDNLITGITWKNEVACATTVNITLSGTQTIDGIAVIVGNRVLVKNQTSQVDNGIYLVASSTWSRSLDADTGAEIVGATVFVGAGTVNGNTQWTCTNTTPPTIGSTNITFGQVSGAGTYTNGTGVILTGNVFSIDATYVSSASQTGYLSSTDWSTFNNKANVNSQVFTGTPTLPTGTIATTQSTGDNSTKISTTAFVQNAFTANTVYFSITQFNGLGTSGSPLGIITDATPTTSSTLPVQSGGVFTALAGKVATTVTVAGFSLSGNITLANLTATDSTLTFSGTYTGATARTIGLNLTNTNNFSVAQSVSITGVNTAGTIGFGVINPDAATVGAQKYSPVLYIQGSGWNTTVTAATNTAAMGFQVRPIQGTTVVAVMDVMRSIAGAGFTQSGIGLGSNGAFTAGTFNKVTITTPTTSSTLTLVDGSSLITVGAFALTLTSTATTNATFPTGTGTLTYTAGTNTWTGLNTFQFGIATSGNANIAAGTTAGSIFSIAASTLTDNITASGTVTNFAVIGTAQTTLAATNASITYTNGFGAYFTAPTSGTNVTMTNKYALGLAFDTTHLATFAVSAAGLLTINATSTVTITPATLISGAITFSSTIGTSNTNFNVIANSGSSNTNTASYLFGGASSVNLKIVLGCGTTAGTIGATAAFANTLIAAAPLTGGTGTNPWVANLAITPLGTITAGSGSITNAVTLFVGAAPTAVATNKYTAYFDTGLNYMVGDLQLRHIIGNSAAPTIAAGTGAGTSPTVAVTGNDIAQKISVTTGTTPTVSATVVTVTFNVAFTTNNPRIILTPANAVTAALTGTAQVFIDDASIAVGSYVIKVGSGGLAASTAYIWYVQVMQ